MTWIDFSSAVPVIVSLIIIEGLLSVDNALAIASMANHLPEQQKRKALKYGIIGAYAFRGLSLWGVAWIVANPWLKIAGAAYLLHLMASHFSGGEHGEGEAEGAEQAGKRGFWATVAAIEVMDLSLSVDNVVAAVAIDSRLWVVCTGVFMGILALRFLAGYCIRLIERFPILEDTAFLLIGFVGCILLVEMTWPGVHIGSGGKFVGIVCIIALCLLYEKKPAVKAAFQPLLRGTRPVLRGYSAITGFVLGVLSWPFRAVAGLFQKKSDAAA